MDVATMGDHIATMDGCVGTMGGCVGTTTVCVGTTDVVMTDGHTATTGGSETFFLIVLKAALYILFSASLGRAKKVYMPSQVGQKNKADGSKPHKGIGVPTSRV